MSDLQRALHKYQELFWSHDGYLSDKWEQYLAIYETEIGPLISANKPMNLLEIGVQNGGSLEIWSKYLPEGSNIVGVDINPACANLEFPNNVHFIAGDACDPGILKKLPFDEFDVIIDDGSHRPRDVIDTFSLLIDRLKPGGKYIIEDLETSYDPNYGGGFRQPSSTIEWAKGFVDALNIDSTIDQEVDNITDISSLRKFGRELWSVRFYTAIVVFAKNVFYRDAKYRRVMAGRSAQVVDPKDWLYDLSADSLKGIIMNEHCHMRISDALVREAHDLRKKQKEIFDLIEQLSAVSNQIY